METSNIFTNLQSFYIIVLGNSIIWNLQILGLANVLSDKIFFFRNDPSRSVRSSQGARTGGNLGAYADSFLQWCSVQHKSYVKACHVVRYITVEMDQHMPRGSHQFWHPANGVPILTGHSCKKIICHLKLQLSMYLWFW